MELKEVIQKRRSYRSLEQVKISDNLIEDISKAAGLMPSCYNKQPWRYIFVRKKEVLSNLKEALSEGNEWAKGASMIIGVASKKELDCVLKDGREYYDFDTGMATGVMLLKLAEAGLVGHAIAGYDQEKAKNVLNVPSDMEIITLIIVGKKFKNPGDKLSEKQKKSEKERPPRLEVGEYVYYERYGKDEYNKKGDK